MRFNTNCRFWRGDKPCPENRPCEGCQAFQPLGPRILLIKLGARGDVLRTTPLVAGLRKKYPDAHITWITSPEAATLLHGLPGLDGLRAWNSHSLVELQARQFEQVICLDKEPWATGLAELVSAPRKTGWGLAPDGTGTTRALNPEAEYSLALGVDDDLKFRQNQKTYPEIIFEAIGLKYAGEPFQFILHEGDREAARKFFQAHGVSADQPILGLFTGCGPAFERKRWTEEGFARLARRAQKELGARVLLLGGAPEQVINDRIQALAGVKLLDTRGEHTLREFGGFLEACRAVVTGDTLALHMAVAQKRPVVSLFGPTCSQEIELFGLGEKITTKLACSPCYRRSCDLHPSCMESISPDEVWEALLRVWGPPA